jgi:hypothetical protein
MTRERLEHALGSAEIARLAHTYVWRATPDEPLREPFLLLASVMDKRTFADLSLLRRRLEPESLRDVLRQPARGLFRPGSWHLWLRMELRPLPPPRAFQ